MPPGDILASPAGVASSEPSARDGVLDPPPSWIGHPATAPMFMERWRSALASGRTSLLSPTEQERYGQLYGLFERYGQHEAHEQQI